MRPFRGAAKLFCIFLFILGLASSVWAQPKATPEDAQAFAAKLNRDLKLLWTKAGTADWIKNTYITEDTERIAAWANEDVLDYLSQSIKESARYQGLNLDADTSRMIYLLRVNYPLAAPSDPAKRAELASIASKLDAIYGKGKWCGSDGKSKCRDLEELSRVMATSRNYDELQKAWVGWRTISPVMRPMYQRMVELANEGAREIGFSNLGEKWRAGYDMPPASFEKETDRLWNQVKPLYDDLHCYVRARLGKTYGTDKVPPDGPIPAHLLGNMWAQEWGNIMPLVEPFKGESTLDVTSEIKRQKYDSKKMVRIGEAFFTSLGFDPLPQTFWERSMFTKPLDREVVCHASPWDPSYSNDLRVKMCIKPTEELLTTIPHDTGHDFYFQSYYKLPVLYQAGANDGFHEAIGDALTLSITPSYLKQLGLLKAIPKSEKGLINVQLKEALTKVAFLPFGKMIDKWRWDVFSGKVAPSSYNSSWWDLRKKYQGVSAPVPRTEKDFDPGAKYHIPANVPYTRYLLARILQFQFHRALCKAAGHRGPLHQCSIYGSKEAGQKLKAMLQMGASKPWPDALEVLTGQREMDATALTEYFAPLHQWLKKQNACQKCLWYEH